MPQNVVQIGKRKPAPPPRRAWLPTTRAEMDERGWKDLDVLLVNGDAYVDHPTFGAAIIGRVLEAQGFRVGILSQPDWRTAEPFLAMGRPRLFVGITSGNMDSMVNHYTAAKRRRHDDAYTPDGESGRRPDRAAIVYSHRVREALGDVTIVLGGVEASLRRLAHYDYWDDGVRRSILMDAKADLLVHGLGEKPVLEIARRLALGSNVLGLADLPGTALRLHKDEVPLLEGRERAIITLPSFEDVAADKKVFAKFSRMYHFEHNPDNARILVQPHGDHLVVVNPGMPAPSTEELDRFYELPFTRLPHPSYEGRRIPAWEQIKFSVTIMRGCSAGCSFCCITEHQGRDVTSRSEASILREVEKLRDVPGWTGVVSDIGGATANMWQMTCTKPDWHEVCRRPSCVFPTVCEAFGTDHGPLIQLMQKVREAPGVKKALVASGVRYDLAFDDAQNGEAYLRELITNFVGGHLKVAPEHISRSTLRVMKKPGMEQFVRFREAFERYSKEAGKEQYLIPYFISSHPGCDLKDAIELSEFVEDNGYRLQQVQDFTPTPMTLASDMHWTGLDINTGLPLAVTRDPREKKMQKALLRPHDPDSRSLVDEAYQRAGLTRKKRARHGKKLPRGLAT